MITELLNAFLITFFVTTFELHPLCQLTRRAYDNTRINGSCCCESTAAEYNLQQLRIQISLNFWKRSRVHVFVNQSRCLYKREHRGFYLSRVDTWSFFFFSCIPSSIQAFTRINTGCGGQQQQQQLWKTSQASSSRATSSESSLFVCVRFLIQ